MSENIYFGKKSGKDLVNELQTKVDKYYNYVQSTGRILVAKYVFNSYYISRNDSIAVRKEKNGRLKINVAELRNSTQYTMSLLANKPTSFDPIAVNSDSKSQRQTKIARNVVDYYTEQKQLDAYFKENLELAIVASEAWGSLSWNKFAGGEYGANEDGSIAYEGDIEFGMHDMSDIIRDVGKRKQMENDWLIVRREKNKYELAAEFPEFAENIIGLQYIVEANKELNYDSQTQIYTDMCYYYEFRHKKSVLMPEGKLAIFISSGDLLYEGPNPYQDLAIYPLFPSKEIGSAFGWTNNYDLVAFQEAISKYYSIMLTNHAAFGYQNIVATKGCGIEVSEVAKGLRMFQVNQGEELKPLTLLATPPEIFQAMGGFSKKYEALAGLNSVVKGNPEASLKSGTALALVVSQAVSYLNTLDANFSQFKQNIATGIINMLKVYANTKRLVAIAGSSNSTAITTQFTKDDLAGIDRVIVKEANPMTKTVAGRVNMADMMLQSGQITPEQYDNVIATGQIQQVLEGKSSQVTLVKSENERLSQGQQCLVLRTDNHLLHRDEHLVLLNDPELREDPTLTQVVLEHVAEHEKYIPAEQGGTLMPPPMPMPGNPVEPNTLGPEGTLPPAQLNDGSQVNTPKMPSLPKGSPEVSQQAYETMSNQ